MKHYAFLTFAFILCAGICAFSFWLGFPGYIIDYDIFNLLNFILHFAPPMNTLFIWLITLEGFIAVIIEMRKKSANLNCL